MRDIRKPLSIYVETSVWSMLESKQDLDKQKITEEMFRQATLRKFVVYISDTVITELSRTKDIGKRNSLLALTARHNAIIIESSDEAEELAKLYVENGIIPPKYEDDASHISSAVVNNISVIVSWNLEHIVKLKTRREVNGLNKIYGYPEIDICTPEEVIEGELQKR